METFENRILLINSKKGLFLTKSIMDAFDNQGVSYDSIQIENMNYEDYKFAYVMIMAENFINENAHILNPLKAYMEKNNKQIIIIGSEMEQKKIREELGDDMIALSLSRILSPKNIAENVNELLAKKQEKFVKATKKKNILVVDDSGVMLRMIMSWLEPYYKVTLANSARIAAAAIKREKPDLILLDYEMPGCSGVEFLNELRTDIQTKDIPVVFLTTRDDKDTVQSVLDLKPQGYILKLMPRNVIIDRVMELVEKYCT